MSCTPALALRTPPPPVLSVQKSDDAEGMWLATLKTFGSLAGIAYPKVAKGAADGLERLVLEVRRCCALCMRNSLF